MTTDPERLAKGGDPEARELVRSARLDAPDPVLRAASMSKVLADYRRRGERHMLAWSMVGVTTALAAAAAIALWFRSAPPLDTLVVRERPPSPSVVVSGATPRPSASVPVIPPDLQPCTPALRAEGNSPLIDDFEDNDTRIAPLEQRAGFWSTSTDGTGTQWPLPGSSFPMSRIPGGRGASRFAVHVRGGTFTNWGQVVSADLSARRCYDASVYGGIALWARGRGHLDVMPKMTQIAPAEYGGSCTHDCYDGHSATITLASQWHEERFTWAEFKQKGYGQAIPFDPHSLLSLEFRLLPSKTPFDYWIDDVRFIER
ncbi:MAG: hypothetical protein ABIQ16_20705 [Polyangiaceae bacterium]